MPVNVRNAEMVGMLRGDFQARYEPQFAWKSAVSQHQALPGLRGFWPTSSFDTNGDLIDLSGQGNDLTYNGNPIYYSAQLFSNVVLDGTGDYFSHVGGIGSWCDITGTETYVHPNRRGVTIGGWFRFTNVAGANEYMIAKWDPAGNGRSYQLYRSIAGQIIFGVSSNGQAATVQNIGSISNPAQNEWFWAAGRYDDATSYSTVWYNDESNDLDLTIAGWAGSLHSNATDFLIGGYHGGSGLMTGHFAHCFTCATGVPDAIQNQTYQQTRAMFGV